MPDSAPPRYVERGGEVVYRAPFVGRGARMYCFLLRAGMHELSRMLDRYLNEPSGGAVDFRPVAPFVMLNFNDVDIVASADPVDMMIGGMREQEVILWTLAFDVRRNRLASFIPYIFVDSGVVMANGREVYGFPKQFGVFKIEPPNDFSVAAFALRRFAPDSIARMEPVISVTSTRRSARAAGQVRWKGFEELVRHVGGVAFPDGHAIAAERPLAVRTVLTPRSGSQPRKNSGVALHPASRESSLPLGLGGEAAALVNIVESLLEGDVPAVFLKQFRDISDPTRASYQAIVEASARLQSFRGGGLLPGEYSVEVADLDAEPIRRELGFLPGPIKPELSFWLEIDFEMETGIELWRAAREGPPRIRLSQVKGT